jgi:hypothetical protein
MRPRRRQLHRRAVNQVSVSRCFTVRFARFFNHTYRVFFNAGLSFCSPIPAMNAGLISELVSLIRSGSPPCPAKSCANAATVALSRPSVANSTRRASRSMNVDT